MSGPTPTRSGPTADPDHVAAVRRLDCAHVRECRSIASDNNWPAFACAGCAAFVRVPLDKAEARLLAALGEAIVSFSPDRAIIRSTVADEALVALLAEDDWTSSSDIADRLNITVHRASGVLALLVKRGQVERTRSGDRNSIRYRAVRA